MNIPVETIVSVLNGLGENKKVQKTILGTYSNGKTRSVIDALKGEIISPEDQLLITKRLNKKKKKKKKNKKKKKKIDMGGITITHF